MIAKRLWRSGEWYSRTREITVVRTREGRREPEGHWVDVRLWPLFRRWV